MITRKLQSGPMAERMRRSVREIAVAVALTVAALVYGITAIQGPGKETASIAVPDPHTVPAPN